MDEQKKAPKNTESNTEKVLGHLILIVFVSAAVLLAISGLIKYMDAQTKTQKVAATEKVGKPEIKQMFLTPNKYSRPGKALNSVKGIVIHYTANPGSTAEENRNYFENLRKKKTTYASSHFVVGIDGEIVQCVPLDEIAYASNDRNKDTISIECCHPNKDGKFTKKTYDSLIQLVSWLCGKYNLKKDAIIRHYDVTGKMCPKYYVEHEDAWKKFKNDVFVYISKKA
jgi:N-acetylmuramoyl-L-alanine amidase